MASDPSETPKHSVSVAAAIVDDAGRFLVIRRADNGQWEPPGGVLELDESIHDGLVREVFEEAGLHVKPVSLTGVYKNMDRGIVALVFRCDIIEGTPHATPEAREVAWLEPDKLASHLSDAYAIRLRDASDLSSAPDVRAHDGANIYPRTIAGESSMK